VAAVEVALQVGQRGDLVRADGVEKPPVRSSVSTLRRRCGYYRSMNCRPGARPAALCGCGDLDPQAVVGVAWHLFQENPIGHFVH